LKIDTARQTLQKKLEFTSQQLSEFYWPIYYRLEKNQAAYKLMSNTFIGERIDTSVILPNHLEILQIIEQKIYLAQPDAVLINEIKKYVRHISMYAALRQGHYQGYPGDYSADDFPLAFYNLVKSKTLQLQRHYDKLLALNSVTESPVHLDITKIHNEEFSNQVQGLKDTTIEIKKAWNEKNYFVKVSKDGVSVLFNNYTEGRVFLISNTLIPRVATKASLMSS
jgi:hypothetical protein